MKKLNSQILLFSVIITILCFVSVFIFTLPPFFNQFNLSDKGNIGDTLGGITAPVIGIISAILLYLALTKQIESNNEQRLKNESDIIFLLINQLNSEIEQFIHTFSQGEKEFKYTGIDGLNKFIKSFKDHNFNNFTFTFKAYFESKHILLLIRSYNLIEDRIKLSSLSTDMKELFNKKLQSIYYSVLRFPLTGIIKVISKHEKMKDEVTEEIELFLKNKPKGPIELDLE